MMKRFEEKGPELLSMRPHPALGAAEKPGVLRGLLVMLATGAVAGICLFGAGMVGRVFWAVVAAGWHVWDAAR